MPQGESVSDVLPQNATPTVVEALRGRVDLVDDPAGADVAVVCVGGRGSGLIDGGITAAYTTPE